MYIDWLWALAINALLIGICQRFPILTRTGWIHAGVLGTILWGCLGWRGWLAVVIYLILGSFVTRIGYAKKQRDGLAEARGGRRGPENLWGSAATGAILAILIKSGIGTQPILLIGFCASFSAKLADTFGSEIGKRWGRNAFLITTLRPVPSGTDGAISLEGTFASAIGSTIMTLSMFKLNLLPSVGLVILVSIVGFISTILESILGALVQNRVTWLSNELVNGIQTTISASLAMFLSLYMYYPLIY